MKCIVTAGPTYEELDDVRRLTNFSTGTLGIRLANHLTDRGHHVFLLIGHYATCKIEPKTLRVQKFTTTRDLRRRLAALASLRIDGVFHAAAVSDFGFGAIWERIESGKMRRVRAAKIPTRQNGLLVELRPTPKIIAGLRGWFPNAHVVGWKFELTGGRATAIHCATRQIQENRTDACVANGRAYGRGFGLVCANGRTIHLPNEKALFAALAASLED